MPDIKYFNVDSNWPSDEKMKLIRSMPEGDAITVIWFEFLAWAARENNGGKIFIDEDIEITDEVIATILNRPVNIARIALASFTKLRMIERNSHSLLVVNFSNWQHTEALKRIRETSKLTSRRYREKQKLLLLQVGDVTAMSRDVAEKSRVEKSRVDIDKSSSKGGMVGTTNQLDIFFKKITELYGEKCVPVTPPINKQLKRLFEDYGSAALYDAVVEAASYSKSDIPYIQAILKRWKSDGYSVNPKNLGVASPPSQTRGKKPKPAPSLSMDPEKDLGHTSLDDIKRVMTSGRRKLFDKNKEAQDEG